MRLDHSTPLKHALLLLLATLCTPLYAEPVVRTEYVYYNVAAQSKDALLSALNMATPIRIDGKPYHGYTNSNVRWRFWWNEENDQCSITKVETTVSITFTLPKLQSDADGVIAVWDDWYPRLVNHENGHMNNAVNIARQIEDRISRLEGFDTCSLLENYANRIGRRRLEALHRLDSAYDINTNYGETQGAWLHSHL